MPDWIYISLITFVSGLMMPFGAYFASIEHLKSKWVESEIRHGIIAFGGGALLSAVALVLIPEGIKNLNILSISFFFIAGGVTFLGFDIYLAKKKNEASQLIAMLADFIPEAMALGALFANGPKTTAPLLAFLIGLQNLPEGFNAFIEVKKHSKATNLKLISAFVLMAFLGPIAGLSGYFWLASYPEILSSIMIFASGGILYFIFQDIAPQAKLKKHWAPPLGAVAGFLLGLIGKVLAG